MIRALLIDDHASYREALAFMLEQDPEFEVAAQAGSLAEARARLTDVEVAVVDLGLPDGSGVGIIPDLLALNPNGIVVVLTASTDKRELARAVEAGAAGILSKARPIREIIDAIHRAASGAVLLSPTETIELLRLASHQRQQDYAVQQTLSRLTRREREILEALGDGLNDREIGEKLSISTETVRTHFVNILGKLNLTSRLQALLFAIRIGIVEIGDRPAERQPGSEPARSIRARPRYPVRRTF
jgi:DNA-binding NarL/FixJ family response regulator